jgi:hypothetical protein
LRASRLYCNGERFAYDMLEEGVKTPLRYGKPLHEMIGTEVAQDYVFYLLQTTASGLLKGQSAVLFRGQVQAEHFSHFRSAEQRLLADIGRYARFIVQLAGRLCGQLRQKTSPDDFVGMSFRQLRLARSPPLRPRRILEIVDDAVDDLARQAFLTACFGPRQ